MYFNVYSCSKIHFNNTDKERILYITVLVGRQCVGLPGYWCKKPGWEIHIFDILVGPSLVIIKYTVYSDSQN